MQYILQQAMTKDNHLEQISEDIMNFPKNRNEVSQEKRSYWTSRDDMAVIDGIILKGR